MASVQRVIYEHPLAYLLGLEGVALMRAFTGDGDYDREFVEARIAEVRALLADETLADAAVEVDRVDTVAGYLVWSATYDEPGGHRVIGVDGSPDMLTRAHTRVPQAEFHVGDLHRLPVPDAEVDLVVCALALTHVPDLAPVLAEFARVLRPGGQLVISDLSPCCRMRSRWRPPRPGLGRSGPGRWPTWCRPRPRPPTRACPR
ncbi:MAG TPA: class I SAM-dependent methyltransferase [Pseudonocardiaceae bacterium]